jgi:hypothetical protein
MRVRLKFINIPGPSFWNRALLKRYPQSDGKNLVRFKTRSFPSLLAAIFATLRSMSLQITFWKYFAAICDRLERDKPCATGG